MVVVASRASKMFLSRNSPRKYKSTAEDARKRLWGTKKEDARAKKPRRQELSSVCCAFCVQCAVLCPVVWCGQCSAVYFVVCLCATCEVTAGDLPTPNSMNTFSPEMPNTNSPIHPCQEKLALPETVSLAQTTAPSHYASSSRPQSDSTHFVTQYLGVVWRKLESNFPRQKRSLHARVPTLT